MMKLQKKHGKFLESLWRNSRLDLRQTKNGRWYDQKVTPDIMSAICAVIDEEDWSGEFTGKDVWESVEFKTQMADFFGKPSPRNLGSSSEYDKVVSQPLRVLHAAGLLKGIKRGIRWHFSIASSDARTLISEIAMSETTSCEFLYLYIRETVKQSGLSDLFDSFFAKEDAQSFDALKHGYERFMIQRTPINGVTECRRIFAKVVNILAFVQKTKGARRGHLSPARINLSDIRYNRTNWRDNAVQKPKDIPRRQYRNIQPGRPVGGAVAPGAGTGARKTVQDVKRFHENKPEILDSHSGHGAPGNIPVQGHHIFPQSEYPALAHTRENIILLTPTQHVAGAHGGDGIYSIDKSYQGFCILKKLESVAKCENDPNCNFYSLDAFKEMLVHVGILNASKTYLKDDIEGAVWAFYKSK